jgi:hypothetical protein
MKFKQKKFRSLRLQSLLLVAVVVLGFFIIAPHNRDEEIDFNADVRPILNTKCISCHGGVQEKSGFSLFSREDALRATDSGRPAIIPGNPDDSEFIKRLLSEDPDERMPYHAEPLASEQIDKLRRWIKQGAHWEEHWAYIKPVKPKAPEDVSSWAKTPIDHFIKARLEKENLQPSPQADRATLLRRLSLDLTGLPPTLQEVENFKRDTSPNAYEKQVDRLLASPQFGERWAAMWLDLARYSDSKGYEKDQYRNVWRYRDYVIRSFNQDKPFNQFTIEQLAGDLLPDPTEEQVIATAYHRNTSNNDEGGTDDEEFRVAALIDRVSNTWEVWQGTTMSCVQCHSHPYDPIRHEDFYTSMAFFNNTRDEDVPNESPNLAHFQPEQEATLVHLKDWVSNNVAGQQAQARAQHIEKLVKITEPKIHPHAFDTLTHAALSDGKYLSGEHKGFARLKDVQLDGIRHMLLSIGYHKDEGTLYIRKGSKDGEVLGTYQTLSAKMGTGFFRDIIDIKPTQGKHDLYFTFINTDLGNTRDYVCQLEWILLLEGLPGSNRPDFTEAKANLLTLLNTNTERTPILQENPKGYMRKSFMFERGNWLTKGKEVQPGTPAFLPAFDKYQQNRLGLAQWLTSKENPLTARVTVNRFWEQLFGYGLVESLEDFGSQGMQPTHPELLDWLAINFMEDQKWSVKKLLKLMVMSGTYQQSSKVTKELVELDPANRLLARGPRIRLTAEQVRDQALRVGGLLSLRLYGKSVMPYQPEGVWQVVYSGMEWKISKGEDAYRRALYTFWRRSSPYPSLLTFDAAGREVCVSRRIRTNTPLQALVTLNDTVYLEAARGLAYQMEESGGTLEDKLKKGYELAVFNSPSAAKLAIIQDLYTKANQHYAENPTELAAFLGKQDGAHSPEKPHIAALIVVANAIMNLDEFVMKE